jgi:Ca2+-binding EF-hand superfamily protein
MKPFTLRSRMIALALAGSMLTGAMIAAPASAATKAKPAATKKAAPDQPPALTRDEAKAHAAEIFDHLDFNKDGTFNEADMKARYEDHLGREFDRLDANHDGSVTKAEFIAAHEQPHHPGERGPEGKGPDGAPPPPPPGADGKPGPDGHPGPHHGPGEGMGHHGMMSPIVFQLLHEADPNHTGSVTKDAFIAAELKRFDEADTNHDGKVTMEELRASHHGHGGRFHHRWGGPEGRGPQGRGPGDGPRGWGPPPHGGDHGPDHGPEGSDAPPPPPLT